MIYYCIFQWINLFYDHFDSFQKLGRGVPFVDESMMWKYIQDNQK